MRKRLQFVEDWIKHNKLIKFLTFEQRFYQPNNYDPEKYGIIWYSPITRDVWYCLRPFDILFREYFKLKHERLGNPPYHLLERLP